MLTAAPEDYLCAEGELRAIYPEHFAELALDKDAAPLSPDYECYRRLWLDGTLLFVGLRQNGALVGYFLGFVQPELHYSSSLACTMDIFYVVPQARGQWGGVKLFRAVQAELKRRGVKRWFVGEKMHKPASVLFRRLGFRPIEVYWSKVL